MGNMIKPPRKQARITATIYPRLSEIAFLMAESEIRTPPKTPPINPIAKLPPIFSMYVAPAPFVIPPMMIPNATSLTPTFPLLINNEAA